MTMRQYANSAGRSSGRGFTLAEVLVCAVLLAIGFVALIAAYGHDTVTTQRGEDLTVAGFLANEVRDMALQMPLASVFAMDGTVYNPAVLSTGSPADLAGWTQTVHVAAVSKDDLNRTVPVAGAAAARVTVDVVYRGNLSLSQTYYVFDLASVPFTDAD
jgi:prepilin-type N-terminal cleavage/methylation domain-containing protein